MRTRLVVRENTLASDSPYRLLDEQGAPVAFANAYLDALQLRGYSPRTLRIYAYDLLDFLRWWLPQQAPLESLTEDALAAYVRHQLQQQPQPAPATINHRLTVVRALYDLHFRREPAPALATLGRRFFTRSELGYGRPRPRFSSRLRVKQPHRLILPLSAEQVARFWASFSTARDLAIVALMLGNGLRSREVLQLRLEDLRLSRAQLLVRGKGDKLRVLPLPGESIPVLTSYLEGERPETDSAFLFVSLKGPRRGHPMTPAGLRSLFRHHRSSSRVPLAHPHRFRHTFGHDMVRAGLSLPALMHLMGHAQIRTTLRYVELSPREVWEEFAKAVQARTSDRGAAA
jgi:site-specific recombinase XerD